MNDELDPRTATEAPPPAQPSLAERIRPHTFTPKLVFGIAIIVAGLLLTLDNLVPDHEIFRTAFKLWPLVLVVMGYAKIRSEREQNVGGYVLVVAGLFGLMVTFGFRHFEDFIGPAILLAAGIFIVTRALQQHRSVPPELKDSQTFVASSAIFSGTKRRPLGPFRGAELTAIFGGFELDTRQSVLEIGSARIDVFVLFGGGEIRVPEGWEVQNQATAIFGGIVDKTPPQALTSDRPRIQLIGLVLFGGVEIRS